MSLDLRGDIGLLPIDCRFCDDSGRWYRRGRRSFEQLVCHCEQRTLGGVVFVELRALDRNRGRGNGSTPLCDHGRVWAWSDDRIARRGAVGATTLRAAEVAEPIIVDRYSRGSQWIDGLSAMCTGYRPVLHRAASGFERKR